MFDRKPIRLILVPALAVGLMVACSPGKNAPGGATERYVSATVQGQAEKINLDAVHEAFFQTAGKDLQTWMGNFEKRINEIYQGDDIVSIDAEKKDGMVRVTGFLDRNDEPGYQAADEKLFELKQTGAMVEGKGFPYELSGQDGTPHHTGYPPPAYYGHGGLLDNPFVQMLIIGSLLNRPYYTPAGHYPVLRDYRTSYRQTPRYRAQQVQNRGFFGKLLGRKKDATLKSQRGFGSSAFGSGIGSETGTPRKRSWFGGSSGNDSRWSGRRSSGWGSGSSSGWSSRRSSGWGGGSSSGWGGRRSFGWGGRRR